MTLWNASRKLFKQHVITPKQRICAGPHDPRPGDAEVQLPSYAEASENKLNVLLSLCTPDRSLNDTVQFCHEGSPQKQPPPDEAKNTAKRGESWRDYISQNSFFRRFEVEPPRLGYCQEICFSKQK